MNQLDAFVETSGAMENGEVTICNPTPFALGEFVVRAVGGGVSLGETVVTALGARESRRVGVSWSTDSKIYTQVEVTANPDETVSEATYLNNSAILPIASVQTIGQAKQAAPGTQVNLAEKKISAVFQGYCYIQEIDRSAGIRVVSGSTVNQGELLTVSGKIGIAGGEMEIQAETVAATPDSTNIKKMALSNRLLGGSSFGLQSSIRYASGLNNIGMLIKTWGRITRIGEGYLYIDDGSGLKDGTSTEGEENIGVKVICDPTEYEVGDYLSVTGISSCFEMGNDLMRRILTRGSGDIVKM